MHPELIEIFGFKIYTYGPMMAIGFLLAFLLSLHIAKLRGENIDFYMDAYIWVILMGLLGAKLLYNIIEYESFIENPLQMMNCRNGGLVWYGGVILVVSFLYWYTKRNGIPYLQATDLMAAPLALGLGIGRWGCFFGGCCYGQTCPHDWLGITYPIGHETGGVSVYPTPLFESFSSLLIALIIYLVIRRGAMRGLPTVLWFLLYPVSRIVIEIFRGDRIRGYIFESGPFHVSTSQFIGIVLLCLAFAALVYIVKHPVYEIVVLDEEEEPDPKPEQKPSPKDNKKPRKGKKKNKK
jgi:phosphatidylglycerol---prolipoprotein diacylglyceryl transferase